MKEKDKLVLQNLKEELNIVRKFIEISSDENKLEREVHSLIKENFWLINREFLPYASNQRLATYLGKEAKIADEEGNLRPDLICHPICANKENHDLLVIELKRPSHTVDYDILPQIFSYADILSAKLPQSKKINIIVIGRDVKFSSDIKYANCTFSFTTYEIISQKLEFSYKKYLDIYKDEKELSDRIGVQYWVDGLPTSDTDKVRDNTKKAVNFMVGNKFPSAIKIIENTLLLTTSPSERAALLLMIGNCKYFLGKYDEAQKHFSDSIKVSEKTSKDEALFGKSAALGNIGLIYKNKGDLDTALKYLKDALRILDKFSLIYGRDIILNAIKSIEKRKRK